MVDERCPSLLRRRTQGSRAARRHSCGVMAARRGIHQLTIREHALVWP